MKKFIKNSLIAVMAMAVAIGFSSCGSDDEDDLGAVIDLSKVPSNAIITANNGEKLLFSGQGTFTYTESGMPLRVKYDILHYENGTITAVYTDPDETYEGKFAMNKDGFITAIETVYTNEKEVEKYATKYEYNSKGLVTKITLKGSENYKSSNESSTDEWNATITLSYDGENLTGSKYAMSYSYVEVEDGETYKGSGKSEVIRTVKSSISNPLRQHTYSFGEFIDTEVCDYFQLVGLFGKAPANLVTEVQVVEIEYDEEDGDYNSNSTDTYSYTFNDNGTIDVEKEGSYSGWTYTYITLGSTSTSDSRVANYGEKKLPRYVMRKNMRNK